VLFRIDPVSDAPLFELRESVVTRRPPAREKGVALTFDEDAGVAQLACLLYTSDAADERS